MAEDEFRDLFQSERAAAEKRFPFIARFRDKVNIAPTKTANKGGQGEFVEADSPDNPMPGKPTITIGVNSHKLSGGVTDTIINDMVHAAGQLSPDYRKLRKEVVSNLSEDALSLAKRRYQKDFKGKFSGSNFSTFDNFLNRYWADGIVQHLLLPENSEINQTMQSSPKAVPALNAIKRLFETGVAPGKRIGDVLNE